MPASRKRLLGCLLAAVLLAAAAGGTFMLDAARSKARHDAGVEAADGSRSRAQDAVRAQLSVVEGRAVSAASNPVLRAQLGVVDVPTLKDGFASETWWEPVRRDFPISGVASGESPDVLVGEGAAKVNFGPLIRAARKAGQASSLLAFSDFVVLGGAAVAESRGSRFVVLVGKPVDAAFLEDVASRTRGAALLSDGKRALLAAGPADGQEHLKSSVGREQVGLSDGPGWASAAMQLAPSLWLWTDARTRLDAGMPLDVIGVWAMAALGAFGLLVWSFRAPAPAPPRRASPPPEAAEPATTPHVPRSDPARPVHSHPGRTNPRVSSNPNNTGGGARRAAQPVTRPKQFGRYYLVDRLGEGGMAEVYTAVAFGAEQFRRQFVIKLLHSSAQRTESLVEMFIDEAKLASGLIHSNIIPVYDFGKMGEEYFMAQEYVLGRDLRRLVSGVIKKEGKPLEPRLAVYIVREALRGLEYAHSRQTDDGRPMGIVHRDVSPNNILASARGEVKLFDFGIAKADEGRLHQTQTGVVKGNVQYMAPEQARGENVDARADVCSMGLVLYYLLTGKGLFRGETAYQMLVQAAQGLTPELLPALEKVPPPLSNVLRVALEPDREQRFQSAAAFENALSQMPTGNATELAREMQRFFGDELKAEQARFASVEPPPEEPPGEEGAGEAGAV
ncbi:MAG TPA: serine/threonine-protein kinase [Myxococcales bacterium]|nr:serine/threonine-protein kinase [Myxococcales bacterium]